MNKITKLKKKLEAAITEEKKNAANKLMVTIKEALDGKFFFLKWAWRGGHSIAASRYYLFKPSHDQESVECSQDIVTLQVTASTKIRNVFEPVGISRTSRRHVSAINLRDITIHNVKEISKELYLQMWDTPLILAQTHMYRWLKEAGEDAPSTTLDEAAYTPGPVDVSHVVLEPGEVSIVYGSPYLLPGRVHLTSPNARAFVAEKLREVELREGSCRHLVEECDREYLEVQARNRASLRAKFKL